MSSPSLQKSVAAVTQCRIRLRAHRLRWCSDCTERRCANAPLCRIRVRAHRLRLCSDGTERRCANAPLCRIRVRAHRLRWCSDCIERLCAHAPLYRIRVRVHCCALLHAVAARLHYMLCVGHCQHEFQAGIAALWSLFGGNQQAVLGIIGCLYLQPLLPLPNLTAAVWLLRFHSTMPVP